jgi:hypothetical protein
VRQHRVRNTQILQVAGVLHEPWDRILIFAPSLALAPAFVLTMVAVYETTPPDKRVLGLSALALATMYATFVSVVYVTQLGVVIPHALKGDGANYAAFACCGQNQFATGIDLLGYTLMSLSTLLAAFTFASSGPQRWSRWWLLANGVLAPFLLAQLAYPALIYVGALWLITFPGSIIALAWHFRRPAATLELHGRHFDVRATLSDDT